MSILARIFKRKAASGGGLFGDSNEGSSEGYVFSQHQKPKAGKPSKAPKLSAVDAVPVHLVQDDGVIAAFGVRWRSLVKAGGRDDAQDMAQKAKGTHYLLRAHLLGYGIVPKGTEGAIYPASILVGKIAIGNAIFAINLGNGRFWLSLVRNGSPTNTDEVLENTSEADVLARVHNLIAQFDGEHILFYSDIQNSGLDSQRNFTLREVFDVVRGDQDRLIKLPPKGGKIPKPVLISTILGALILAGQKGYTEYQAYQARLAMEANQVIEELPEAAWAPVVAAFVAKTPKPNHQELIAIRKSLDEQPVLWAGWFLKGARCQAGDLVVDTRTWSCQASYDRSRVGETSEQMRARVKQRAENQVPAFPTITTMVVTWTIKQKAEAIVLKDLGVPGEIVIQTVSKLQGFLPSLTNAPDFKMTQVEWKPPIRKDGKPHPKPETVPDIYMANLTLNGPMRSIDAVTQVVQNMQWDAMGIEFNYQTAPGQKSISTSSISVELSGKVFATK